MCTILFPPWVTISALYGLSFSIAYLAFLRQRAIPARFDGRTLVSERPYTGHFLLGWIATAILLGASALCFMLLVSPFDPSDSCSYGSRSMCVSIVLVSMVGVGTFVVAFIQWTKDFLRPD